MFYPLKFKPVYKDYVWGGRNFEKLGRTLPEGIVAESWEISCHPNGESIVSNGEFSGTSLPALVKRFGRQLIGLALPEKDVNKFPLLVKFLDAENKPSVQVHPDDAYAQVHENGEYGKNEMWYIISAKPGAKLIYDVVPGTTREAFANAVKDEKIEVCLKEVPVAAGDVINIPSGIVHAVGEGIMLAEIQQNSDTTYRVYDYNRTDKNGSKRPLHIEKALDVINFNSRGRKEKVRGLEISVGSGSSVRYLIANRYFSVELCSINGSLESCADGSRFYLYVVLEGQGEICHAAGKISVRTGESLLIPASMGSYSISGSLKALRAYVPDVRQNVIEPLLKAGYEEKDIYENVDGLSLL